VRTIEDLDGVGTGRISCMLRRTWNRWLVDGSALDDRALRLEREKRARLSGALTNLRWSHI